MRNKFLVLASALVVLCQVSAAHAQRAKDAKAKPAAASKSFTREYGMAGCGLGSVLIDKHGSQVFAATTNDTAYSQFFGISSGTLNCIDSESNEVASRADFFIKANRFALESDVARGSGETLAGLGKVLGCAEGTDLGSALQQNYSNVFVPGTKPNIVTDSIITVILRHDSLAGNCHLS